MAKSVKFSRIIKLNNSARVRFTARPDHLGEAYLEVTTEYCTGYNTHEKRAVWNESIYAYLLFGQWLPFEEALRLVDSIPMVYRPDPSKAAQAIRDMAIPVWADYRDSTPKSRILTLDSRRAIKLRKASFGKSIAVSTSINGTDTLEEFYSVLGLKDAKETVEKMQTAEGFTPYYEGRIFEVKALREEFENVWAEFYPEPKINPVETDWDDLSEPESFLGASTLAKLKWAEKAAEPEPEYRAYKRTIERFDDVLGVQISNKYEAICIFKIVGDTATLVSGTITLPDGSKQAAKPGYEAVTHAMEPGNWVGWERIV